MQLRRHCNPKATPTSRQSIWHIISIFCFLLFENIAFWEVPPGNHKCRLAYLMLTRSVMPRDLHSRGVAPCALHCNADHIRFRSQSTLSLAYAVTLTFDPLTLNADHVVPRTLSALSKQVCICGCQAELPKTQYFRTKENRKC